VLSRRRERGCGKEYGASYDEIVAFIEHCIARRSKRFPASQLKICNAAVPLPRRHWRGRARMKIRITRAESVFAFHTRQNRRAGRAFLDP
jgi:hypothetical protein